MVPDSTNTTAEDIQNTIAGLRMLTDLTGAVHELQVQQLKAWPLLVFNDIDSCTAEVDVGEARVHETDQGNANRCNRLIRVAFNLSTTQELTSQCLDNYKDKLHILVSSVRFLFFPDTEVTVFINNYKL